MSAQQQSGGFFKGWFKWPWGKEEHPPHENVVQPLQVPIQTRLPAPIPRPLRPSQPLRPGVYPVPQPRPIERYIATHAVVPPKPVIGTSHLPPDLRQKLIIAASETQKDLRQSDLPEEVLGQLPGTRALVRNLNAQQPRRQQTGAIPMQKPDWLRELERQKEAVVPTWLIEQPMQPPKKPSGFLVSTEVVLSEEEMKSDLGEDPEATMQRKAVRKERE